MTDNTREKWHCINKECPEHFYTLNPMGHDFTCPCCLGKLLPYRDYYEETKHLRKRDDRENHNI